jgi:hypothetical protein
MQAGNLKLAGATIALAALVAGCSDSATNSSDVQLAPRMASVNAANGELFICKYTVAVDDYTIPTSSNPPVNTPTSGTFTASVKSGDATLVAPFAGGGSAVLSWPSDNNCIKVATGATSSVVTVTETPAAGSGLAFYRIATNADGGTVNSFDVPGIASGPTSLDITIGGGIATDVWFKNMPYTPPPQGGNEGCTPGYWKQDQHFDSWAFYTTGQSFNTVFGGTYFTPDITLLAALGRNGGGINALARHSVAALLNATNGTVDYPDEDTASIIADFQAAVAGGATTIEAQKNTFDSWNNGAGGCPLN